MASQESNLTDNGRNPAILIRGAVILIGAMLLLIFGGRLLNGENTVPESAVKPPTMWLPSFLMNSA